MRDYPVSILRVEKIMRATTKTTSDIMAVADSIDDEDFQKILGRLSVISTRMGLLVSCHDVPELRDIDEMIDPAIEERFFSASEEFIHQVDAFIYRAKGVQHVQA